MKNISSKFRRGAAGFLLGASLVGIGLMGLATLAGCASIKEYTQPIEYYQHEREVKRMEEKLGYKFLGMKENKELILKDNDIYLQKIDGTGSKQITHTPQLKEHTAVFSADGNYIIFVERYDAPRGKDPIFEYFVIKSDSDDSTKREITLDEAVQIEGR